MTFKEKVQVVVSDSDNFIYPKKGNSFAAYPVHSHNLIDRKTQTR